MATSTPPSRFGTALPAIRRERLSELISGGATSCFSATTSILWATSRGLNVGPTASKSIYVLMCISSGCSAGFGIIFLTSLWTATVSASPAQEAQKRNYELLCDYLFLVTSSISAVAVGGIFPDASLIAVYQSAERNAILDQNITLTWFVASWAVIWGVMRAWNARIRRGEPVCIAPDPGIAPALDAPLPTKQQAASVRIIGS